MKRSKIIKYIALLFVLTVIFVLSACNDGNADETTVTTNSPTEATEPTEAETQDQTEAEVPTESESETEEITEALTDEETETEYIGPEEPGCPDGTCSFKTTNGKPICQACGFVALCNGVHDYAADQSGHWKPACEYCKKASGRSQNHEYVERIDDAGDSWEYAFRCTICKYIAYAHYIPFATTAFYSAGELSGIDTGKTFSNEFRFEAGTGFAAFTLGSGGTGTIKLSDGDDIDTESGRYLVMKLRLPTSQVGFTVDIRSACASDNYTMSFNDIRIGWVTMIVDMTKAASVDSKENPIGYCIDANEEYYLAYLGINARVNSGESFDLAYVMICDTLEEAKEFTADEKQIYFYSDIANEAPAFERKPCIDENGNEIVHQISFDEEGHTVAVGCDQCGLAAVENEEHNFAQMRVNGDLTHACAVCEYLKYGCYVNKYITAQEILNNAVTYYRVEKSSAVEDGIEFARFNGRGTAAQVLFARNNYASSVAEEAAAFPVGSGNLLVIRMRTNAPEVKFSVYVSSIAGKEGGIAIPTSYATVVSEPDAESKQYGWTTYVIDLERAVPSVFVPDENGEYKMHNFYLQMGTNKGEDYTASVYYDFDFMAFVDSWDEIKAIVSDRTVVKVNATNNGTLVMTKEKECVGEHSWGEDKEGSVYSYLCINCGKALKTVTIPEYVKRYFSGYEIARNATVYSRSGTRNVLVDDKDAVFGRVNGCAEIWWARAQSDYSLGATGSSLDGQYIDVGNAKYFVVRAKANVASAWMSLYMSTTGKNGNGYSVSEDGTVTRPTANGYTSISVPISRASSANEWRTYVYDLEATFSDYYVRDAETGHYIIDTLAITYADGVDLDIEFMAFIDGEWDEIAEFVSDETVVYITSIKDKNFAIIDPATGKCAEGQHLYYYVDEKLADGNTVYSYMCGGCGDATYSKTVTSAVTKYISGSEVATGATTYSASGSKETALGEDGVYYGRVSDHQEIWWMRHQQDYTSGTGSQLNNKYIDVGQAKYLVVRMRSSVATNWLSFYISTTGRNGEGYSVADDGTVTRPTNNGYTSIGLPFSKYATAGEWTTYVFDLEAILSDYYVKDAEAGRYILDTFAITYGKGFNADFEFIAFVDGDWDDIGALTDDETVVYMTSREQKTYVVKYADTGADVVG